MTPEHTLDPFAPAKPDWAAWAEKRQLPLWVAVALACDIDPDHFQINGERLPQGLRPYPAKMADLLAAGKGSMGSTLHVVAIGSGDLDAAEINLANFASWLLSIKHVWPTGFPWTPEQPDFDRLDWPWGRYSTKLLRKLAEAADRFWKNYDPSDESTAPTNKQVKDWLESQGVPMRTAEVMATILRADGLPTGPRK